MKDAERWRGNKRLECAVSKEDSATRAPLSPPDPNALAHKANRGELVTRS
jgi:hypothetical protein